MMERFKKLIQKTPQAEPMQLPPRKEEKPFCDPNSNKPCITVCAPHGECECDCEQIRQALNGEIQRRTLSITVGNAKTGCAGKCKNGPFIGFPQRQFFYLNVQPDDIPAIIEETLMKGRLLFHLLSVNPSRSYRTDIYYEKQTGLLAGIDDQVCMVEVAKYFLDFEEDLSCGKCVPCRLGMKRVHEDMNHIVSGQGTMENLEQIRLLCETMSHTSHCEFAMTSVRPVLSAIQFFEDEFRTHIEDQMCPTGVCQELIELQKKKAKRAKRK